MFSKIFKKSKEDETNFIPVQQPVNNSSTINYDSEIKSIANSIEGLAKSIRDLENKVTDISNRFSDLNERVETNQNEINNIKNNMEKIFSIYEILIKNYNPFVEEEKEIKEKINVENVEEIENKILPLEVLDDNPTVASIVVGWLSFLLKKSNVEEVEKALDYYEDINWINEKVKIKLKEYLNGLVGIEEENKKLTPMDHLVSLYIISKISQLRGEENIERLKDLYRELVEKGYISPVKND
jgi:archaellum component FlaD/FlaE